MNEFGSFYKSIRNRKYNTWCVYTTRLDTYGCGCQHNCKYCYSKSLLSFRGLFNEKYPRVADLYKIKNKIKRLPRNEIVKLGGMTDCFQPLELKYRITFRTILILNQFRISYLIVTKSSLVSDPYYTQIYDKNLFYIVLKLKIVFRHHLHATLFFYMGRRQVVSHRTLDPAFVGSNPTAQAS